MTETNRIEFKERLTRDLDIEKEVVAFLNYYEGGILYIGIDKNGNVLGVEDIDGDMLRIKDRIRNNISPSPMGLFDVTTEQMNGKSVIKVFMASGSEKPYYKTAYGMSTKGCYLRVGTAAEPMPQAMIDDLFSHRIQNSLKNVISPRQDLSFSQLRIYYEEKGLKLNDNFLRSLDLLTDDGKLNYVAYLLADENGNSMKLAKYAGTDRVELSSNNEYGYCCLLTATRRVLDKLVVENKVSSVITPTRRIDTPQWDGNAIREAVINAIVHNDYTYGASSKIELFADHLEITSIGRIPQGLSKDDFFRGVSMPRNRELMRVFRDVEVVEALGSGMERIMRTYSPDNFEFGDNFIRMTVPYKWLENQQPENDRKILGKHPENVLEQKIKKLTERQQLIIRKMQLKATRNVTENVLENVLETNATLAVHFHISERTIRRDLKVLQDEGFLRHDGPDNGGKWIILNF